ncbi:MAG: hypothetical protein ACHQ0J_15360 [Candidatus Dormibacterales bacterium]
MANKIAAVLAESKPEEELEDLVGDADVPRPVITERTKWPEWNGRSSKVHLHPGRTINRDFALLNSESECIDCLKRDVHTTTHQFHARATRLPRNAWFRHPRTGKMQRYAGPEGEHVSLLEDDGMLANSAAARRHDQTQRDVDQLRGIAPEGKCRTCKLIFAENERGGWPDVCPECGARNGLSELGQLSTADLEEIFRGTLPHEAALDIEKSQIRDEQKQIRENNRELVEGMTSAVREGNEALIKALIAALRGRESEPGTGAD